MAAAEISYCTFLNSILLNADTLIRTYVVNRYKESKFDIRIENFNVIVYFNPKMTR